jgi:hypothetical protein
LGGIFHLSDDIFEERSKECGARDDAAGLCCFVEMIYFSSDVSGRQLPVRLLRV